MKHRADNKTLRSFGLLVGGVFLVIGFWPVPWRNEPRDWALIIAALLILPAFVFPRALEGPYWLWMRIARVLGWINTRLILGAVYFLMVLPLGFGRRHLVGDPLSRRFDPSLPSYRVPVAPRDPAHLERQF